MSDPFLPRDCYDLAKEDHCEKFGTYKDIDIVLGQQQTGLNCLSRELRLILQEIDMFILILQLAYHLEGNTTLPRERLSRIDMLSRPNKRNRDGLNELERLYNKRRDVKEVKIWLYDTRSSRRPPLTCLQRNFLHLSILMKIGLVLTSSTDPSPKMPIPSMVKSSVSAVIECENTLTFLDHRRMTF